MEITIDSQKNNALLNRTEVYFTVKHKGVGTPSRDLVRNELADKLNAKKDDIVVDFIKSGFGMQEIKGYAKVYTSLDKTKGLERVHILKRNKIPVDEKKRKKDEKKSGEAPKEITEEKPKPQKEEKPAPPKEEKPAGEKKE